MNQRFDPPSFDNPHQEAVFWRGVLVHHYAIVEFKISDLIIRTFYSAEYQHLPKKMSYPWSKRLKQLGCILDAPGPLSAYSAQCRNVIGQIGLIESDRHLIVHGVMRIHEVGHEQVVHFECYDAQNNRLNENRYYLSEVRYIAQETGSAAEVLSDLIDEMISFAQLLPIPLGKREARQRNVREF
ncbi:hypothetical protein [Sphingomonas sp. Sph1(2015)]|uniref:hypothetical protein n=1 Tax=Sphingomonas sp. Sph1(2015) TaxID=1628084 RepID=UPI0011154C7C|nr:hypothetical protein [Sphingomonas sp. Sph1(2015)]